MYKIPLCRFIGGDIQVGNFEDRVRISWDDIEVANSRNKVMTWILLTGEYGKPSDRYIDNFVNLFFKSTQNGNISLGENDYKAFFNVYDSNKLKYTGGSSFYAKALSQKELKASLGDTIDSDAYKEYLLSQPLVESDSDERAKRESNKEVEDMKELDIAESQKTQQVSQEVSQEELQALQAEKEKKLNSEQLRLIRRVKHNCKFDIYAENSNDSYAVISYNRQLDQVTFEKLVGSVNITVGTQVIGLLTAIKLVRPATVGRLDGVYVHDTVECITQVLNNAFMYNNLIVIRGGI
jgi:hypothetical protein